METVFITGVSSGIGRALAHHYLDEGRRVLGCSRREPSDLVGRQDFDFRPLDLSDESATRAGLTSWLTDCERIELAILNAGILSEIRDLPETDLASMKHVLDVNLWANKTVIDALFATVPRIDQLVTISSGAAVNGNRGWGAYSISKAALNMLTKLYARERPDTHFCAFAPGIVDTAMQEALRDRAPDERFPSLEMLRSKQHTTDMPSPAVAAVSLATAMARLPEHVESGEFADVRTLPG